MHRKSFNSMTHNPFHIVLRAFLLLFCVLTAATAMADDVRKPDSQIADNTFFDPTRKEKKVDEYHFGVEYRIEVGYAQNQQRSRGITYPDMFLHGARMGATFTFLLPLHFSMQVGALYTLTYGQQQQHWRSMDAPSVKKEYIEHRILEHNLTVPIRAFYTISLWRELNLFFYGGPQLQIGLGQTDYMKPELNVNTAEWLNSIGVHTEQYDRIYSGELIPVNIQLGVGGGLEWARYRVQAGYDFGLNNQIKHPQIKGQHMWEWGWFVTFSYRL